MKFLYRKLCPSTATKWRAAGHSPLHAGMAPAIPRNLSLYGTGCFTVTDRLMMGCLFPNLVFRLGSAACRFGSSRTVLKVVAKVPCVLVYLVLGQGLLYLMLVLCLVGASCHLFLVLLP